MTPSEYGMLKRAFMGGFTHANAHYVDQVCYSVASEDFASSYPAVMLFEKFPMSRAHHVDGKLSKEEFDKLINSKCCCFDLIMYDVCSRLNNDHPIPVSKCWLKGNEITVDNGRVVEADVIGTTVTEQDFFTYREFYDCSEFEVKNFMYYDRQYLPKQFAEAIVELYEKKTRLKGIKEELVNYIISKNMLNASFGMEVTDPVRKEYYLDNDNDEKPFPFNRPDISEAINEYNTNVRRFLYYPWGVWTTAYARRNLFKAIKELGPDYLYADTDSVKFIHPHSHYPFFDEYNHTVYMKAQLAAMYYGFSSDKFSPLNNAGVAKHLGFWEYEGEYTKFKTLGAKRYLYEQNGSLHLTVAGVNKKKACEYLATFKDPFDAFSSDLVIPEEYSGRLISTYIDTHQSGIVVDYNGEAAEYDEYSSVHLEPTDYTFNRSQEFIDYLLGMREEIE